MKQKANIQSNPAKLLEDLKSGNKVKAGPQLKERQGAEPLIKKGKG